MLRQLFRRLKAPDTTDVRNHWSSQVAHWLGNFQDQRVLDVGCDPTGDMVSFIAEQYQPREVIGLNPVCQERVINAKARLVRGDIRKTDFETDYFDSLISVSAFEHIHDFGVALQEMYRILKPGGYLYSQFGPIWSTSYGHHLWLNHCNDVYTYWNTPLSPFCHLLKDHDEIVAEALELGHSSDACQAIADFVLNSSDQNQLMFEDYRVYVESSSFEICFFKGYDYPELNRSYNGRCTPLMLEELRQKFPAAENLLYDGITLLLRKPPSAP